MDFSIQERLQNDSVLLEPLCEADFEELYQVASDPTVWEQHPNKNRWKKDVFKTFFVGAIQSKGAFKVIEKNNGKTIGSTRFYDFDKEANSIHIGYTFYGTESWGKGLNHAAKTLMLDFIFQHVSKVLFHIGAVNIRSQKSIEKLGATKIDELVVAYFGEEPKLNFVYCISRNKWV